MTTQNHSFEQLDADASLGFDEKQQTKLVCAIRERSSKKGLESFGITILIVEDQDFSRKLLHDLLSRESVYSCYVAKNAVEAMELYATHAPDIVLLDINLPDFSGHDIASVLKKSDPHSHIVYITGSPLLKDIQAARQNNVKGFIAKPYSKNKIQTAIDHYVTLHTR
ncbi:MAG: response regulator [Alphaproteobacteria bacterium]|nr:response regulator [Alphaproteobacteria bacterium]